jgi:hypothetical protein
MPPQQRESLAAVERIAFEVRILEAAARAAELRAAQLAEPEVSRLWEVDLGDGRKTRMVAIDAATLQKRLQKGATVVAQVFPGGYVKPLDGPSPMFDGWLQAHGEECTYLAERGFTIKRT